jgi:GNAT superfamily N-acetyltransferase
VTQPGPENIYRVLDATWPPASFVEIGPWRLREGQGGGQRVSAATAISPVTETDIVLAVDGMRDLGQRPIFMIRPDDGPLDGWLAARGYQVVDPVHVYVSKAAPLTRPLPPATVTPAWPPLAVQREIWAQGGIGPARLAVMARASGARTALLGRIGDTPAGVAFVATDGGIAMLHALEVLPDRRRSGVGRMLLHGAANWAETQGADWLTLAVTQANAAANALYRTLGMTATVGYHYRRAPETAS